MISRAFCPAVSLPTSQTALIVKAVGVSQRGPAVRVGLGSRDAVLPELFGGIGPARLRRCGDPGQNKPQRAAAALLARPGRISKPILRSTPETKTCTILHDCTAMLWIFPYIAKASRTSQDGRGNYFRF